jgi:hypothetical protein
LFLSSPFVFLLHSLSLPLLPSLFVFLFLTGKHTYAHNHTTAQTRNHARELSLTHTLTKENTALCNTRNVVHKHTCTKHYQKKRNFLRGYWNVMVSRVHKGFDSRFNISCSPNMLSFFYLSLWSCFARDDAST